MNAFLKRWQCVVLIMLLVSVGLAHWLTPVDQPMLHALHVAMRKLFIVPVVLAAIWFNLPGALLVAGVATAIYLPHVMIQWGGQTMENMNQIGEIGTLWVVAVLSGWYVDREKNALHRAADAQRQLVHALVAALDAREHDTGRHSQRVRSYASQIAREMGLDKPTRNALDTGALLHDVGKIGIPDHILLKPGPLTDDEWTIMRQHPRIGAKILHSVPFTASTLHVVESHHERYDGSGYPVGLQGEEIPLTARIFAVADALDAMTSDRPYRSAMSIDEARRCIEQDVGTHFDPAVVQAFMRIAPEYWITATADIDPIETSVRTGG
ncbi:HD domain-containing protein [Planctomycetales bacterium ZRK34]|nr:HD domain-containing protein [Planctomycetales bacterium ZRK34]